MRIAANLGVEQTSAAAGEVVHGMRTCGLSRQVDGVAESAVAGEMEAGGLILVGEYVEFRQPEVWLVLVRRYLCFIVDWARVMEERPKSGIGGLLPGENYMEVI